MNYREIKNKLHLNSPFILKTKIEKEDHLQFREDMIVINGNVTGAFSIDDRDNYYIVKPDCEHRIFNNPILIALEYNNKPIILSPDTTNDKSALDMAQMDAFLKLIPQAQYLADEKAEL